MQNSAVLTPPDQQRIYTVRQVADELDLNTETVRAWLRAGQIQGVRPTVEAPVWMIPEVEVLRLFEARGLRKAA